MGPGQDQTCDPWISNQKRICSKQKTTTGTDGEEAFADPNESFIDSIDGSDTEATNIYYTVSCRRFWNRRFLAVTVTTRGD